MASVLLLAGAFGLPQQVAAMLGGTVVEGNTQIPVYYNNWGVGTLAQLQNGAQNLDAALASTGGEVIVMAHSLGAVACAYWLANYGPTTSVSPELVSFILLGNSNRPYGGFCYDMGWFAGQGANAVVPTNTPFTVTDFARQYDGWADFPQLTTGTAADILAATDNALQGQGLVHPSYQSASLDDPTNTSYVVGNVTYQWGTTYPCPILGTSQAGISSADSELRPFIEAAYNRVCGPLPAPDYLNFP